MPITIADGWIHGELPGPGGTRFPVDHFPRIDQKPWSTLLRDPPDLCLHTTEGSVVLGDAYKRWEFPPNFACGDHKIVQLFPLGYASEAVDSKDGYLYQVELAWRVGGKPVADVYLPVDSTLLPLVALTAFLHQRGLIRNGLGRPNESWPVALDRGPQASESYYRRTDGSWGKPGVYGHVEIPDDEHWDPGSFNYPEFFGMVQAVIDNEEEEDVTRYENFVEGQKRCLQRSREVKGDPGPPPETMEDADRRDGWALMRAALTNPRA